MTERRILLADCDQMFVAVARLADPDGAGRAPLLVVGGKPGSRGVVCSASYEVRAFGVRSGMPISRAARLCPTATFVPVPRDACSEKSRQVRAVLETWAPIVEPASIDEFYLDMSGTEALYRNAPLEQIARDLRNDVRRKTGLSLSIGGGTNRLVAKLAAERAKPRSSHAGVIEGTGVWMVGPGGEGEFLATHTLAEIPGVGPRLRAVLGRYGLQTVRDALAIDEKTLASWLGPRTGEWMSRRIRGRGGATVDGRGGRKSMSREATFGADISDGGELETELLRLAARLAADLRRAGLTARSVTVKIRDYDFQTRQASRTLAEGIVSDRGMFGVARELLGRLRAKRRLPVRLLGIGVSRFEEGPVEHQLDLMPRPSLSVETARDRAVAGVVDRVNARFGRHALEPARLRRGQGRAGKPR